MQIIIAIIGVFATVITVSLTNFYVKRNRLKFEERKLKEEYYAKYIKAVSQSAISSEDIAKAQDNLSDSQNQLLLVGSPKVVAALMDFHSCVNASNYGKFTIDRHDELLTSLIKAMREDLYQGKKVNTGFPQIHLSGRPYQKRE